MTVNEKPPAPLIVDETAFFEAVVHALETARAELAATARTVAEMTADRDELRVELARLRSEMLAYVESTAQRQE